MLNLKCRKYYLPKITQDKNVETLYIKLFKRELSAQKSHMVLLIIGTA